MCTSGDSYLQREAVGAASLRWNADGLLPAIVQDASTGQVLMMAWVSPASLARCLETGETWFWSRSRQCLWHKGETSGNTQRIQEILVDCDADTLLMLVTPAGPACHTGAPSCFYRRLGGTQERS
jgi:phosphoribosyl-AMP cyclohydrolase